MRVFRKFLFLLTLSSYLFVHAASKEETSTAVAADFVRIHMIHDQLLLIQFDDGRINYHGAGQTGDEDVLIVDPLNVTAAGNGLNYAISSNGDPAYASPQRPVAVYRKSKPTDFARYCQGWAPLPFYDNAFGCVNEGGDRVQEHWLYLALPAPLQQGPTYTIELDELLNAGMTSMGFIFDDKADNSEAIHVNQLGYSTAAPSKYAYVHHWAGDAGGVDFSEQLGNTFGLIDQISGAIVFTGELAFRAGATTVETFQDNPAATPNQNFIGAAVYECDFSAFNVPGTYRLYVEGIGASFPFEIGCSSLRPAYTAIMKAIYKQRSGIELTTPYTDRPRPAPHNPILTPGFSQRLIYTTTTVCEVSNADAAEVDKPLWEAGAQGVLTDSWGWYQDAGDWDAYHLHLEVPTKLLLSYQTFPENFGAEDLNLPESTNGLPDMLDEARWLLRFYYRLKTETEANGWTTGGVPGGRIFGDLWGGDLVDGIGRGSWQDTTRNWYVSGEDVWLSYTYAALAAHFAYLLQTTNLVEPEGIDWTSEAISAWNWAEARYDPTVDCFYLDQAEARNYAAATLYGLTQTASYATAFAATFADMSVGSGDQLRENQAYGSYFYLQLPTELQDQSLRTQLLDQIEGRADFVLLDNVDLRASRWGGDHFFPMLIGNATTPYVFEGLMAYGIVRDENPQLATDYLQTLYQTADYFLGGNALNMCWITGMGDRSPAQMLILDDWYDGVGTISAGYVPYGPWRNESFFTNFGPWTHMWANSSVYPGIDSWPGHERWFNTRYGVLNAEFTIHQNLINAAVFYGALGGAPNCSDDPNSVRQRARIPLDFVLSPNPGEGQFRLSLREPLEPANGRLRVYDQGGRLLMQQNQLTDSLNFDLGPVPAGVYFVELRAAGRRGVQRYIKQ
ncbi:MAG: glycoside hydrolase family 9 protein [Bacteroidota bacterium]